MFTLRVETVQATFLATIDCKLRWVFPLFLVSRLEFQLPRRLDDLIEKAVRVGALVVQPLFVEKPGVWSRSSIAQSISKYITKYSIIAGNSPMLGLFMDLCRILSTDIPPWFCKAFTKDGQNDNFINHRNRCRPCFGRLTSRDITEMCCATHLFYWDPDPQFSLNQRF